VDGLHALHAVTPSPRGKLLLHAIDFVAVTVCSFGASQHVLLHVTDAACVNE
jgi:hypothetical protein